MKTAYSPERVARIEACIDIIDVVEEALEIAIADLVLNRVFVERHFPHNDLFVRGDKKELLLVHSYLIFNAIDAMDGLAMKVLKIRSSINTAAHSILITYRTNEGPSEHWALNKDSRCVPSKKNGYCHWLEITEAIMARLNGTITVHNQPGKGLNAVIKLPLVAGSDFDHPTVREPDVDHP